jgi:hypothetical protein
MEREDAAKRGGDRRNGFPEKKGGRHGRHSENGGADECYVLRNIHQGR